MPTKPLKYYERRDAEIGQKFLHGSTFAELAAEYQITTARIREILRWKGYRKPTRKRKRYPFQILQDLGLDRDLIPLYIIRACNEMEQI